MTDLSQSTERAGLKTLFLQAPSFDGFDGGAGSRYQAKREVKSFWYPTWLAQPAALVPGSRVLDAPADEKFMHAATYSGHPVCCAVGLANIDIIEKEGMVERARVQGDRFRAGLETLLTLPNVGEVRGIGMLAAIELVEDKGSKTPAKGLGAKIVAEAANRGVILRLRAAADGPPASGDTLCFAPPLPTPEATLNRIVEVVGESIQAVT